jgi:hypothetical protein
VTAVVMVLLSVKMILKRLSLQEWNNTMLKQDHFFLNLKKWESWSTTKQRRELKIILNWRRLLKIN